MMWPRPDSGRLAITRLVLIAPLALNFAILLERTKSLCGHVDAGQEPQFQSMPEFFGELNFL